MVKAYSYDLRIRVLNAVRTGMSAIQAGKTYNISRKVVYDWKKLEQETGDIKPKTSNGYQRYSRLIIRDISEFKIFLEKNSNKSSNELSKLYHRNVSHMTILRMIHKLGYTYKKNFFSSKERCWCKK